MIGLGINGGGICSAEELVNAITAQNQMKEEEKAYCNPPLPEGAAMKRTDKVPDVATIEKAFNSEMTQYMEMFGIPDSQTALKKFTAMRKALMDGGVIPKGEKFKSAAEVKVTFDAIYKNYKPGDAA